MTRAVIFDLGGVLIDWNPRYLYAGLFGGDTAAMEHFLSAVCTPEWNRRQDAGRPLAEATAELIARYPEQTDLIRAYYDRWQEMIGGPVVGSVAVLAELHDRRERLFALTNWSAETFDRVCDDFEFLGWFEGIVVSGRERLLKPDESIFRVLLDRYALTAERSIYVDDLAGNVEQARRMGMDAILFTDPGSLRVELRGRGLLNGVRGAGNAKPAD